MSKPSRRPGREERKLVLKEKKKARKELKKRQAEEGLKKLAKPTLPNAKSPYKTVEQEQEERQKVVEAHLKVLRTRLPGLLARLAKIEDPRNPKTIKHKATVLLLYGLLMFVLQYSSRREANREMSMPKLLENLRLLFPELETLPHHDTLNRFLSRIDAGEIEAALVAEMRSLIVNKKLRNYLVERSCLIAIDGTWKLSRDYCWSEECLERRAGEDYLYYVYVLEANLVLENGVTLPLLSEFLEYSTDATGETKQDCELKAFRRLAARLKKYFPRLSVALLLDGLYANGPAMAMCRKHNWDYMIVLKDDSLPSVWDEVHGLSQLQTGQTLGQIWGDRRQHFYWVNGIEYEYKQDGRRKTTDVHVAVCEECWEEIDPKTGKIVAKTARHAWLSGKPMTHKNIARRCNQMGRFRWKIENNILKEKHQGYQYEHCFSYNWNAMKGYHYLMRLGHLLNILAHNSIYLAARVRERGIRGMIKFLRETLAAPWLDAGRIRDLLTRKHQLRLE
jgi:hypothetical protein